MAVQALRVLIVDDEKMICELIEMMLTSRGAEVITAASGNQALKLLKDQQVDVILSDVRMADGDGPFLVKSLPVELKNKVKIYFMSGFNDLSEADIAELGVRKLFPKPFNLNDILAACGL